MPSDSKDRKYAMKRSSVAMREASRRRFLMSMLLMFLAGYGLAWYISPEYLASILKPYFPKKQTHSTSHTVTSSTRLPQPKFEFYTLLTQEKVAPSAPSVAMHAVTKSPPVEVPLIESHQDKKNSVKESYFLQIASFQKHADAEQMKASLLMRGFEVSISTVQQPDGKVWHRVLLGPYVTKETAEKIQAQIAQRERISGIIRRMDA